MELNYENQPNFGFSHKENLPNANAVLVLGILSIVCCCCCYVPSITMGIIAIVLGAKGRALYFASPEKYTESSFKNLNAGYICAIIGLALTVLLIIYSIVDEIANPGSSNEDLRRILRELD